MRKERGSAAESSTAASERIELKGLYAMMLGGVVSRQTVPVPSLGHARRLIRARQWAARVGHPFA